MRKVENVEMVYMTIDEVKKLCLFLEENRNHYSDAKEAAKHYFSEYDTKKTSYRINSYKNRIFSKDKKWKECSPMIVYVVDNKYYIVDGQGRFIAVDLYNTEAVENEKITEIPVQLYYGKSYNEMIDDALSLNTNQKNWSTEDVWRTTNLRNGNDEKVKEMMNLKRQYEDELGVKSYTSKLILFGYYKASHREGINRTTDFSPYHTDFFNSFKTFYDIAAKSCDNNQKDISTVKRQDAAQAFYRVMAYIIRTCKEENIDYTTRLDKASRILGDYVAGLDRIYKFKQVLGGKQKAITSYFVKEINRKTKDRYIKQAMLKAA